MTEQHDEPVAWMYHMPGDLEHGWHRYEFKRRIQSYEGMSCVEEDAGMIETPLYTRPTPSSDMVEAMARAIAAADGLDFDEVCGCEADPDLGECDSGTCVAAHSEDHDADECCGWYRRSAKAAATVAAEAMAAKDAQLAELRAEVEMLRGELRQIKQGQWFYLAGDMSSDRCRFSPSEVIDEDWLYDNRAEGSAVVQMEVATPLPDIWCAVRFFTNEEKDARQSDDDYELTEHASEADARAALGSADQ